METCSISTAVKKNFRRGNALPYFFVAVMYAIDISFDCKCNPIIYERILHPFTVKQKRNILYVRSYDKPFIHPFVLDAWPSLKCCVIPFCFVVLQQFDSFKVHVKSNFHFGYFEFDSYKNVDSILLFHQIILNSFQSPKSELMVYNVVISLLILFKIACVYNFHFSLFVDPPPISISMELHFLKHFTNKIQYTKLRRENFSFALY